MFVEKKKKNWRRWWIRKTKKQKKIQQYIIKLFLFVKKKWRFICQWKRERIAPASKFYSLKLMLSDTPTRIDIRTTQAWIIIIFSSWREWNKCFSSLFVAKWYIFFLRVDSEPCVYSWVICIVANDKEMFQTFSLLFMV